MKTLLWISRHEPNKSQISQIENKLGKLNVIKLNTPYKEDIRDQIHRIKPDCIVGIIPVNWLSYLLRDISKSTIWLKPKCKSVHPGEFREEHCVDFNLYTDIIINPEEKRYEDYITKGDNIIHLRHGGYERVMLSSRFQLMFINWK